MASAFDENKLPRWVSLHPGSNAFYRWTRETLVIATGAITGTYYDLGRTIQSLLEPHGIESLVMHTDGSIENVELQDRPLVAIMQYDIALAARSGVPLHLDRAERPMHLGDGDDRGETVAGITRPAWFRGKSTQASRPTLRA